MHPTAAPVPVPPRAPAPADPQDADHAEAAIATGRARIDELDAAIIELVKQRLAVSRGIQRVRMAGGGRRIEHSREVDIVNRYAAALGQPGADVALALLSLARGSALAAADGAV